MSQLSLANNKLDVGDITRSEIDFDSIAAKALAFTIAIAWNDAVSKIVQNHINPGNPHSSSSMIVHAGLITLIVIIIAFVIRHVQEVANSFRDKHVANTKVSHSYIQQHNESVR
jgi:hypothetical protein